MPQGCKVRVESETSDQPITVYAVPLDYKTPEKAALSFWTRIRPAYGGFYMAFKTSELMRFFSLVPGET